MNLGKTGFNIVAEKRAAGDQYKECLGPFNASIALRYQTPNGLYTVDLGSGAMTRLSDFDVSKIAADHA